MAVDVSRLADATGTQLMERHGCLVEADCVHLSCSCEKGAYCDRISIVASATGSTVSRPEDPDRELPAGFPASLPAFRAIAIADRFGHHR